MKRKQDIILNNSYLDSLDTSSDLDLNSDDENESSTPSGDPLLIDQDDPEVQSYYQKIQNKAKELYHQGQKQAAADLLWEELEQPYLPETVYNDFYDLYTTYSLGAREEANQVDFNQLSKQQIYNRILVKNTGKLDTYFIHNYLCFLSEQQGNSACSQPKPLVLDAEDHQFFNFIFKHPFIPTFNKVGFLNDLRIAGVQESFEFMNHDLQPANKVWIVTPNDTNLDDDNPTYYHEVLTELKKLCAKQPDVLELAMSNVGVVAEFLFPIMERADAYQIFPPVDEFATDAAAMVQDMLAGETAYDAHMKHKQLAGLFGLILERFIQNDNDDKPYSF